MKLSSSLIKIFSLLIFVQLFSSCAKDQCTETFIWYEYEPIWVSDDLIHPPVEVEPPRSIKNPGKIYSFNPYVLINEVGEGLHIVNNTDPKAPVPETFLKITGNIDMAMCGHVLYADSYFDLISIDMSDLNNIHEIGRIEMFKEPDYFDPAISSYIVGYNQIEHEEEIECGRNAFVDDIFLTNVDLAVETSAGNSSVPQGGIGGSMARFTVAQGHLYIADQVGMTVLDLSDKAQPEVLNKVDLGWGIETIIPYEDKLFIGANNGMHIIDAQDPANPRHVSTFEHARACDPVYVSNDIAFVTLRDGTECEGFFNQMDVIDVEDLFSPRLIKSYEMHNPHGLSISENNLYLCEGSEGLKAYDISNIEEIDKNLLDHEKGFHAYDVISLQSDLLLLIGQDGFYQFNSSEPENLELLSVLSVER